VDVRHFLVLGFPTIMKFWFCILAFQQVCQCHCHVIARAGQPVQSTMSCDLSGHLDQLLKDHGNEKVVTAVSDLLTDTGYVVDIH